MTLKPGLGAATNPREIMLDRLAQDLIGPRLENEALISRPSDVYLTGILWPKNTRPSGEEDERLAVASAPGESEGAEADVAQPQHSAMRRPSTAGVSFAAKAAGRPKVRVTIAFGAYKLAADDRKKVWKRQQYTIAALPVDLTQSPDNIPLNVHDVPGLRLNVRSVPFPQGVLSTVTLVNEAVASEGDRASVEHVTIFQVSISIEPEDGTELIARPSRRAPVDDEDWSAALLYRDAREFAAGHTCSADWVVSPDRPDVALSVGSTWMPRANVEEVTPNGHEVFSNLKSDGMDPLSAAWLSAASPSDLSGGLSLLTDAYEKWIDIQAAASETLNAALAVVARKHLKEARDVLERMRDGISFIENNPSARASFQLANLAMATQRQWSSQSELRWRPFQLGFLLLTAHSAADGNHPDRNVMDLLWFPTGGGKTEAYLALIAFVSFFRRISRHRPDEGAGVAAIMRYTLRLLTTQQFMRASVMICACEAIRRGNIKSAHTKSLGSEPFGIGLWVGDGATPNRRQDAFDSLNDTSKSSPRQLSKCPCCRQNLRYTQSRPTDAVSVHCTNATCMLFGPEGLPVWTVDEDVYAFRPTLIIGTVDKFAQIVRNPRTASLFSVGTDAQPQLILQDELHLISGPLGTVSGLYESAIDLILSAGGTRPKIIGSTATIRRAPDQVLALFDRKTCQFPSLGLNANDSGFTVIDQSLAGRAYVGVTTAGRSAKFALQAVSASLLQAAAWALPTEHNDNYWTLVAYFNSLRELGGALVLMQDDVHDTIQLIADARSEEARKLGTVEELTSRRQQSEIRNMLETLEHPAGHDESIDAVLATNMLSVGVDISRLGLMVVNGQPKTMAEYIQSTSRVGRGKVPGLVVPVLNNAKPRDRSHFETFKTWHGTLYREVEATSVTPFASRARDRALHAVLVAVVRHLIPGRLESPQLDETSIVLADALITRVADRARRVDPAEAEVGPELRERLARWVRRAPDSYWNEHSRLSLLQSAERAAALRATGRIVGQAWPTPNTMRGVEPATPYRLVERLRGERNAAQ